MSLKRLAKKTYRAITSVPKHTGKIVQAMAKDPLSTKNLTRATLAVGTFGGSLLAEGQVKAIDAVKEAGHVAKRNDALSEALAIQQSFDAQSSAADTAAKRKAAEEQLARRRGTPGRPVFTSLINRGTLLR